MSHHHDQETPYQACYRHDALRWVAADQSASWIGAEEVSSVDHCRQVVELGSLEAKCVLVAEDVGVVQGGLVEELEKLSEQEDRKDDELGIRCLV